ncbi:DUF6531 domain-containing protein [Streptomyces sp. uw30]|uniref:DUF6531 domain-containing protein n=1 Tax=Streptomyces sp. uw30 TaxID=1828179 RepID=UPI001651065E|nr:DUF6531 domain-containing protein [Streptomyces sp. uw30]
MSKKRRPLLCLVIAWCLLLAGVAQASTVAGVKQTVDATVRIGPGPTPAKAQTAMSLKQRRAQVAKDRSDQQLRSPLDTVEASDRFRDWQLKSVPRDEKKKAQSAKGAAADPLIKAWVLRTELRDSAGNIRGLNDGLADPKIQSFGAMPPVDGEKFTVVSNVFYITNSGVGQDLGPKPVKVRLAWTCSVYGYYARYTDYRTVTVPSMTQAQESHGTVVTFDFTFDENVCRESIERNEKAASPNPYDGSMWFGVTVQGTNFDGSDSEWTVGTGPDVNGFALSGLPDSQTYGSGCSTNVAGARPCTKTRGLGIDTATGSFKGSATDAALPGITPTLISRSYASNNSASGPMGTGWSVDWDTKLDISTDGDVTLVAEDGSRYPFTQDDTGAFRAPLNTHSTLRKTASGYELKSQLGDRLAFDPSGNLLKRKTYQGGETTYSYSDSGQLAQLVTPEGRTADFTYSGGIISEISISDGRKISYGYTSGRLTSVVGLDGQQTRYSYDDAGRLQSITDPRGNTTVKNTYDSSGRVKTQDLPLSGTVSLTYKNGGTDTIMPDGGIWTDVYSRNVLLAEYDPFGNKTSYEYSYRLDPVAVTDALGNRFVTAVDKVGRLIREQGPLTKQLWKYDSSRDVSDLQYQYNGNSKRSSYSYDTSHRLTISTDPLGKATNYTYTAQGQLETVTDPRGKLTTFAYDTAGNRVSETFPDGSRQAWGYDAAGNLTSATDPRGTAGGATPAEFTTSYGYDAAGRLLSTKDAKGNTTRNTYDVAGNLATVTDAAGKTTSFTYDAANRLTEVKDAAGHIARMSYDVMGNVASRTDASGAKTAYAYDKAGRLIATTAARGNVSGATKYTWKYGYDKVGNRTTVTDPLGNTIKTDYDAEYRPIAVTDPLGKVRKTEYDGEGNITRTFDALGKATAYTYDANNQPLTSTDRGGKTVSYTYDDAGNLASETSPLGSKTTYGYDDNGRLTTTVEPRGNVSGADPAQYTWSTAYDAAGNILSQSDPYGNKTVSSSYDGAGQLIERADALGKKTAYEYDELGRLTNVTAPDGGITSLGYDAVGNLTSRKDANGHTTNYTYDGASRPLKITDPLGRVTSFDYDADGNRTSITNARGQKVTSTYDARNLLTQSTFSDGTPTVAHTYDAAGRPKTIKDGTGTRTVTYDDEGRPLTITSPGATNPFKYTYNDNGTIKSRTYPDGRATTYAYDSDSQIVGQSAGGKTTSYTWDAAGNLTSAKLPTTTVVTEARTYDRAGRLASVSQGTGARNFERDAAGRVVKDYFKDAATTGLADRYAYDAAGRMTRACTDTSTSCLSGSSGSTYAYDKVGNLTTSSTSTSTRTNTYDAADQLTKRVEGTTTVDFTYDADGNLTKDASGTYVYDPLGRLKSATLGSDAYAFVNDADGNRTTTNKNGVLSRTSSWDVVNPLAQIATETNSTGALIADYQYNPEGVAESQNRTTGTFYMRHDRQNSITAVYDAAGKETYTYTYTAWGVSSGKESTADGQSSIFGYTGQYKDPVLSGRLYLRERSYDPGNRRFATTDPEPAANDSANPSPYAYANNDPINQSDPSGRCPLCVSAGIGAAIGAAVEGGIYSWQHRNGGFTWGGLAKAGAQGAATGAVAGALMPGAGNVAARSLGLSEGRGLAASTAVNSAVGAGFSWGLNKVHCRPTTPWDLVIGAAGGGSSSLIGPAFSWLKNRLFAPTVTVSAHTNRLSGYAYRGLRADEDPSQGLRAAGTNPDVQAWQHVVQDNDSPWISLSRDPNVAWKYSGQGQKTIVAVDLSKLDSETIDAAANLRVPHEFYNFAKDAAWRDKEILVKFTVPADAIVMRWPAGTDFGQILRDISEQN